MPKRGNAGHRQKLKEHFLASNENSWKDEVLLELLLTYSIPRKDVKPLARELLQEFKSLSLLLKADTERLRQFKGVKFNTIVLFKLIERISANIEKKSPKKVTNLPRTRQLALLEILDTRIRDPILVEKSLEISSGLIPISKKAKKRTGLFGKAVLKEAIELLPEIPQTDSLSKLRIHLRHSLHYSAMQTRVRYANYIVSRMFPEGRVDEAMRGFARSFKNTQALRDVCFYRFLKAEPLELEIVEKFLLRNIGKGSLTRDKITSYLSEKFPTAKSINSCSQAIVDALRAARVAKVTRTNLTFSYREIPLPAFAFIVHSEFTEPGIYSISLLEDNRFVKAMLWNPERIVPSLYELRNLGIIGNVSQIDGVRQFTTRWNLDQAIELLISKSIWRLQK